MAEITKACSLNEFEVKALILDYSRTMDEDNLESHLDRMNYLNKRLKSFSEIEIVKETPTPPTSEETTKARW